MANKALKFLKFPGLSDTYTIPQIDTGLNTAGKAAESKATGDAIAAVNTKIGKLEKLEITDTASGPIASFPDGSDNMPLKSLVINIDPVQDLHGYDNPWPAGGGKNLHKPYSFTNNDVLGVKVVYADDGSVILDGTASGAAGTPSVSAAVQNGYTYTLSAGTYTISLGGSTLNISYEVYDTSTTTRIADAANPTFTLTQSTTILFRVAVQSGKTYDNQKAFMQLESGSSATSYAPYSNLCPISGHTGANVTAAGKNLVEGYFSLALAIDPNNSNKIILGGLSGTTAGTTIYFPCKKGVTYVRSHTAADTSNRSYWAAFDHLPAPLDSTTDIQNGGSAFTPSVDGYGCIYLKNTADSELIDAWQIEPGTVATSFEARKPITHKSITFPSTIYGGTDEVVSGSGKKTMEIVDLGDLEWTAAAIGTSGNRFYAMFPTAKIPASTSEMPNLICSVLKTKLPSQYNTATDGITIYTNGSLQIYNSAYAGMTSEEFTTAIDGEQLCYELATPSDFSTTPITVESLYGQNNIWADTGDVEVEYVADPKLYINKIVAALA